jgi:hypothetical protein
MEDTMKKLFLLIPFFFAGPAMALDAEVEENYKQNYSEQVKPLVMKKLSSDRPDMTAKAIKAETNAYVAKMASCQLKGMSHFPENYQEMAVVPVAEGEDVSTTTQALNQQLKQDVEAGKISKDEVMNLIQVAQQNVQACMNS